jgi:hypothetical protein
LEVRFAPYFSPGWGQGSVVTWVDRHMDLIFFSVLRLELRAYTLNHSTSPFLWRVFSR